MLFQQRQMTVYGCGEAEAQIFSDYSLRFGLSSTITDASVSTSNAMLSQGCTYVSVNHKSQVSESILSALKNVGIRQLSTRSIGTDHIDIEAASRLGISVHNAVYSPGSVADHTLLLMLMAVRNAQIALKGVEQRDFRLGDAPSKELRDLTIGILGTGRIGRAVIKRLKGFGCKVIATGRTKNASVDYVPQNELLRASDILSLHVPLTSDTYHLIGKKQLEMMQPGALLINTARGALVDTNALVQSLQEGRLGGAALDVLEGESEFFYQNYAERPLENPLLSKLQELPNVIITPHTAYYTERMLKETVESTVLDCLGFERKGFHFGQN